MKESKPETRLQIVGPGHGAVSLEANGVPIAGCGDMPRLFKLCLEGKLYLGLGMRIFFL